MRVPIVLTKFKVMAGGAVILMAASTVADLDWLARWSLLASVLAVGVLLGAAVREAADSVNAYIKKWSHQTFESGFKAGVEQGREMEAAERFIASATDRS